ncbi:DEKNAAC105631 [Brettanomyces naardenensis]|uniref:DEKNAAC105631 n=1 Tax=Brettanomyces naardenensis TaxID=13370 RepID=A0A448YU21_BRENA|nr:DEKNAAC105631 [Brettanomyces naardenensis]
MTEVFGTAKTKAGVISLLHTVVGAGLLSNPYAVSKGGLFPGIILILISAFASLAGLYCLSFASKFTTPGHASFFHLSQKTIPALSGFFDLAIAIKCFGVSCSHLIIIGDLMPQIAGAVFSHEAVSEYAFLLSRRFWITLFIFLIAPLAYRRTLRSLRNASVVALISASYLVILVFLHFIHLVAGGSEQVPRGEIYYFTPPSFLSMLSSFPIFVFGFTCHQNEFTIINEQADKSLSNLTKISFVVIGAALIVYLLIGISGYLTFGDNIVSNIIRMYPDSPATTMGRFAIVVMVSLSYPLQSNPTRASINHIYKHIFGRSDQIIIPVRNSSSDSINQNSPLLGDDLTGSTEDISVIDDTHIMNTEISESISEEAALELTDTSLAIITTLILLLSYTVAYHVSSLGKVLAIVGATGSCSISYILPGFFAFVLADRIPGAPNEESRAIKAGAFGLTIWGIVVMFTCLTVTIYLGAGH